MLVRLRRNRTARWLRNLTAETTISASDLILPIFITEGTNQKQEITKMPGVFRLSIDQAVLVAQRATNLGIPAIALFPCVKPELKTDRADEAYNLNNLVCRAVRTLKDVVIDIGIICDVALDPYTTHGHDGIVNSDGYVDNDCTVEALCKQALVLTEAGADIVAPSDMMDGRILAIRKTLNNANFKNTNILAYAAKYASNFYGPFRSAVGSGETALDKSTYQMDIRNIKEAMREIEHDISEGADMIMIKPGMPFLDVVHAATTIFRQNILAYQVSGEYSMLKFAAMAGIIDWQAGMLEALVAFKRAGASAIFTYAALEFAEVINDTIR